MRPAGLALEYNVNRRWIADQQLGTPITIRTRPFGPQHIKGDTINITARKTGAELSIRIRSGLCWTRYRTSVLFFIGAQRARLSRKSPMGTALAYMADHWEGQRPKIECTARLYSRPRFLV